jgi:peroxidase
MGLLASDQALALDLQTKSLVQDLAKDKQKFFQAFAAAIDKMSLLKVMRGKRNV